MTTVSKNTSNTQQAFWIALGSLFSFGFGIVSSMILSRYFPKADYGTYRQVLYVYSTLLTVFTLGLPKAFSYFLPRVEDNQAKDLIKKITNLFFGLGAVFSVTLFFASGYIAVFLKNPDLELALKIFSPVPLLMLPTMGLEGILSTYRMTKFMAVYTIVTRTMMLLCVALPVMLFGGDYIQAIIGFVIASFVSFLLALYLKYYPVRNNGNEKSPISFREILQFSIPLLFASLWGILAQASDQFFISRYFGNEVFAEFSNGFMDMPFMGMIVGATATVLSPVFARMSHENVNPKKEIFPLWISVFEKSAMLIYPLLIYTLVFADTVMVFLYGAQYVDSALYYRIYNISNLFKVIVYAPLIINIGKIKFYQNVYMYTALILIPLEYLSVLIINSPYAITVITTVLKITRTFIYLKFISDFFGIKFIDLFPIKLIIKIALPSLVILFGLRFVFLVLFDFSNILVLIISFVSYVILYALYAWLIKLDYLSLVRPLLVKVPYLNKL